MQYFRSTAVKRGDYDASTGRMVLWFAEGHSYTFCGVPTHVWEGLCNAPSQGRYYNAYIRDRYQC